MTIHYERSSDEVPHSIVITVFDKYVTTSKSVPDRQYYSNEEEFYKALSIATNKCIQLLKSPNMSDKSKQAITFIIQHPSPDLDNENYQGVKVYIRGVVFDLVELTPDANKLNLTLPAHIYLMVLNSFQNGNYRAEILDGQTMYKFYKKPERSLVPKEQDGTALEKYQKSTGDYLDDRLHEALDNQAVKSVVKSYCLGNDCIHLRDGEQFCTTCPHSQHGVGTI